MAGMVGTVAYAQSYRETYPQQDRQSSDSYYDSSSRRQVAHFNKASNLIGADVRTRDAEKVGEVKDVVIDFESGRVAYIVVDANDVLEGSQSHVAVPARAFRVTRDQNHVTLTADRNRLRSLRSFSENSYPAFRSQGQMSMQRGSQQMDRWQRQQQQQQQQQRQYGSSRDAWSQDQQYGQGRNQQRWSQQGSTQDPDLYLYEWYVYDVEPGSQDQDRYSSGRQSQNTYGGYGSSQYGTDRYSSDRPYQDRSNQQSRSQYQQRQQYQWDDRQRSDDQDNYWRQQQQSAGQYEWDGSQRQSQYSDQDYNRQQQQRSQSQYSRRPQYPYDSSSSSSQGTSSQRNQGQGTSSSNSSQSNRSNQDSNWSDDSSGQPDQPTSAENSRNFSGRIREIDHQNRTLTVEGSNRTMNFKLSDNPTVKMSGQENASFSQLEEGKWVQIGYRYEDGSNKAFSINQTEQRQSQE